MQPHLGKRQGHSRSGHRSHGMGGLEKSKLSIASSRPEALTSVAIKDATDQILCPEHSRGDQVVSKVFPGFSLVTCVDDCGLGLVASFSGLQKISDFCGGRLLMFLFKRALFTYFHIFTCSSGILRIAGIKFAGDSWVKCGRPVWWTMRLRRNCLQHFFGGPADDRRSQGAGRAAGQLNYGPIPFAPSDALYILVFY